MISALLVDDEPKNSETLIAILGQYCPAIFVSGSCTGIAQAEQLIEQEEVQLLFLDVQMPNGTGFDLLDRVKNKHLEVIFVTAYDNFLLKAIRYSALDYILKPVSIPDLIDAVKRAEERIAQRLVNHQLELLLSNIRKPAQTQRIAIPSKKGYDFIPIADILRLEAQGSYTEVHLSDGKNYLTSKNIKEYEDMLPADTFCRVHHAHLVNLNFIRTYHRGRGGYLEMNNGVCIQVSVRKKDELLSRFR
jgi:two-component system LytT family response regulator